MIVTVKTGKMGWSQVTVRRATGTCVWVMHIQSNLAEMYENFLRIFL